MLKGEKWWGGTTTDGTVLPLDENSSFKRDLVFGLNQTMPMFISNLGRCIWSEEPFIISVEKGEITLSGEREITLKSFGKTLKDAYVGAMNAYFNPTGKIPPSEFFAIPQYNTWMQLVYDQTQDGVLAYAKGILAHGFKAGIIMIDEGWQNDYGDWTFNKARFPEPKKMIDELHAMGFKVMLWLVPYVSCSGKKFVKHTCSALTDDYDKYFLRTKSGLPAIMHWWNGYSAVLDMTNEWDRNYLKVQLDALISDYGVDGFKFDGGDMAFYAEDAFDGSKLNDEHTPAERNIAWNEFGSQYKYHEYKDTFKGGGKRTIQRTCDRNHSWTDEGINTLIPNAIMQGLMGHPFICPDMVGGGQWTIKENSQLIDQELFVRMAQCSALFPMMQFSWAPWEAVDEYHLALIKKAHDIHLEFAQTILKLVDDAVKDGQPILRSLEYNYPHCGYENINDTFMLGKDLLVAPIVVKGQTVREITLPDGDWKSYNGKTYKGGQKITLSVTLEDLPYFVRV